MSKVGPPTFPVVGLGGSAGGLRAFFEFFESLSTVEQRPAMSFIVVLHLPRDQESHLTDLLRQRTGLAVQNLEGQTEVAPDVVYVLPPSQTLTSREGLLELRERAEGAAHHPVDDAFNALASAFGERSVAIVCSGTGSNGSSGLTAVREAGGCVIAQAPESAEFDQMPRNAIQTGAVDVVAPPVRMIDTLIENASRLQRGGERGARAANAASDTGSPDAQGDGEPDLNRVLAALRKRSALDFRQYKPGTLNRRIERRMHFLGLDTVERYATVLEEQPDEVEALVNDLLITVTSFFRDDAAWQVLAERAVGPMVAAKSDDEPLRAWAAGCATGEEAYSVAITVFEAMRVQEKRCPVEIFATDASHAALTRARGGDYPAASIQHLAEERQERWFRRDGDRVRVKTELREVMIFAPQDLIQDPPFSQADLLVCRNVLIYLQPELQRKLIRLFHFALREGGCLFLGNSESIGDASDLFEVVDKAARIYRRLGPTRHDLVEFPVVRSQGARRAPLPAALPRRPEARPAGRIAERARRALADRHAPPSVVIDHGMSVLYYHGATERYLRAQTGEATHNLLALARDGLAPHLRRAVEAAKRSGTVETARLRASLDGGSVPLLIGVAPVAGDGAGDSDRGTLLISFTEGERIGGGGDAPAAAPASSREKELEDEARLLREEIDALATASGRSEEEFKAYNEELTSMNEELRAANEELETSKEELQSLNEELSTVNHQLRSKVEELRERTSDLQNLLSSTDVAILFLDNDLNVRWFSPSLERLFHIREADVQRPVAHLVRRFSDDALEEECRRVLRTLSPVEAQVEAEGRVFMRRITPYRTVDDRIAGVVVTFSDVTAVAEARLYAERIVETVPTPFLVLDPDLRVRSANDAFYETFLVERADTEGRPIFELGNRQWDIPELRRVLKDVLPHDDVFERLEVEHEFEQIGRRVMLLNGRRLDHVQLILLSIEDITERKRAGEHQELLMRELAHRVKNALGVVQGLANVTLRRSGSLDEFQAAFGGRLSAYARSHDQLLRRDWRQGDIREIVAAAVNAHAADAVRVQIEGPSVEVGPTQALALGLILHELETNAVKYGALSNQTGSIDITWAVDRHRLVQFRWEESNGPPVEAPGDAEGFGSTLIRQLSEFDLGGSAEMSFAPAGVACALSFKADLGGGEQEP